MKERGVKRMQKGKGKTQKVIHCSVIEGSGWGVVDAGLEGRYCSALDPNMRFRI
jgi:hypothetical protein